MSSIYKNNFKKLSNDIIFLWNIIKKNKYPSIYKINETIKIIPLIKDRILIKNTLYLINENQNYINYNYEQLMNLLYIIQSRLNKTILYWNNIDDEIIKLVI